MVFFVSLCFTRLSDAVSEFLRVLSFLRFRPAVVSGDSGRGKPKVTSPFDSLSPLFISCLLTSFVCRFPFKSYSTFSFRLEIPIGAEILAGFWNSRPLNVCIRQRDPEKARPCVKPCRLSHHACLCDAPFGRYAIARRKHTKNKIKTQKKESHKVFIFHVCVGHPYPTDCNGSLHIGLGHQRNQSCKFFWL
jgi:hypothetical protein